MWLEDVLAFLFGRDVSAFLLSQNSNDACKTQKWIKLIIKNVL